jgi:ubiquitin carboxyl-terminal hydrolase 36/42
MASAALSLAGAVVAVAGAAVVAVARGALRRAAARREEVRRLARLAAVEAEVAEREAYCYARGRGGVAGAPLWTVPEVASPREDEEEEEAEAAAAAAAVKGVCVVCRRPTTFRCKRCKGVKYWSVTYHPPRVVSRAIHVELFPLQFMLIMMWHCANGIKNSLAFLKNKGAATPLI